MNQIAFIGDLEEASKVKKNMEKGYRAVRCDLEKTMIEDINLIYEAKKAKEQSSKKTKFLIKQNKLQKNEDHKIKLKEMKKTK